MVYEKYSKTMRYLWFLGLLFFAIPGLFAAVPIQDRALRGAAAADARLKLIAAAESFLGTPYRFGGLDRRGLDCSGLVHLSFREGLNLSVPRTTERFHSWAARIDSAERQPGDLVFFVTVGSRVSHLGIYAGDGSFIHSASEGPNTGVIFSQLTENYWRRTYLGTGRALPWDAEAAVAMAAIRGGGAPGGTTPGGHIPVGNIPGGTAPGESVPREPVWADSGVFVGFAAAWTWGGLSESVPSPFRGLATIATVGYKWSLYRTSLELRPEWDDALGVFRVPITLSVGTDTFQVFGGPVYSFGNSWLWGAGISAAFYPIPIRRGAVSLYGELAWQPNSRGNAENSNLWQDFTANLRASTGVRYLWRLK